MTADLRQHGVNQQHFTLPAEISSNRANRPKDAKPLADTGTGCGSAIRPGSSLRALAALLIVICKEVANWRLISAAE